MTMDLLDYDESEFHDGVTAGVGAATALERMADADIQLLV
jgi:peroxiredoxin family protein